MASTRAPRTPRATRADETRQRLLEVAASAFAEQGYAATSMSDLVHLSGLTRGAFYFHFDSKEALALAAFRRKQQALIDRLVARQAESREAERAIDRLVALIRARANLLRDDPALGCMVRLCVELRSEPRLAPQLSVFHEDSVALLAALITRAQGEGDVRTDLSAERMARVLFAALVGIEELGEATAGTEPRTEDLILLLVDGLRPR